MILSHGGHHVTNFNCTLMNEIDDGDTPVAAYLIGNVLIFKVVNDRSLRPEEEDMLYFYEVTEEQRDKLLSWPENERDISCEWVYHNEAADETVDPNEYLARYLELDEDGDAQAKFEGEWSLELDVSI